jgi:phosphoribosylglycinamide formyltransferase 1
MSDLPEGPDEGVARRVRPSGEPLQVGVLASGRGSNLQAILDATAASDFPARVAVVVSDREQAAALERARRHGVPAVHVDPKAFGDAAAFEAELRRTLEARAVGLVCLAGFMRVLRPPFVRAFAGRLLNIHPSLLPAFPGLAAPRQAIDHGVKVAGATVHFVDEGIDTGPIVLQAAVAVGPEDTAETLAARILTVEHRLYPEAIRLFAEGRLRLVGRRVLVAPGGGPAGPDGMTGEGTA